MSAGSLRGATSPIGDHLIRRCEIHLQNPCRYPETGARQIRPWLEPVVRDLAPRAGSFAVRFVSDREMRRLNATYRRRDESTDVLSFSGDLDPASDAGSSADANREPDPSPDAGGHLGDVVISVPTSRRQARRLGHSVETELRVLLLHGVLHCLGHDHETDGGVMDALESQLRRRYLDHE